MSNQVIAAAAAEARPSFRPVKAASVRTQVLEALRRSIFSGELQPGDALREAHLARDFQVSQATVREALIELEHAGLVVRTPNKETLVTRLTAEEIAERGQLRAVLETMAGVQASQRMTAKDFQVLEEKFRELESALAEEDYFRFSTADLAFHRAIWEFSGNRTLYRTLQSLTVPLFAFLSIRRSARFHDISRTVRPHKPIIAALRSKKPERIEQAFRDHIEGSYRQLMQLPELQRPAAKR